MRILLVEDQKDVAISSQKILEILGHEVRLAMNGGEALGIAQGYTPDVALIDMGLPDMCGTLVGSELRQLPKWGAVFLIALTGYNYEDECYRIGFDFFQHKPMNFRELPDIVAGGSRNPRRALTPADTQVSDDATRQ